MDNLENLLKIFRSEVANASWSFFVWKGINNISASDRSIYQALNANAISWSTITHSLQSSFFITLGRLFDLDVGAFSVHAFLRCCIENIDQFGKEALRKRHLREFREKNLEWLDKLINDAYVPTKKDFQRIRGETSKYQSQYEDIYRPIRNKVIAHKEKATLENVEELFEKTNIGQIEGLIFHLVQVQEIVFQLLYNGRLTSIGDHKFDEEKYVMKDVQALMERIRPNTSLNQDAP